ncbi:hypothetical protein [Streptomyces sp. NPDC006334]|uniref:hypothetical protein n=1 Tax=Streptomyces sp. NPDC006334 TaxID=3156754 RepID=UPI0033AFE009
MTLPLGQDRAIALRVLLTDESFTVGWGGESGDSPLVASFESEVPPIGEMTAAVDAELSRKPRRATFVAHEQEVR